MDHRQVNHGFSGLILVLVVFAQSPIVPQPTEGPFDHPALGQQSKALAVIGTLDNDQGPLAQRPHPSDEFTGITAIGPHGLEPRPTAFGLGFGEDQLGSIPILESGGMHDDCPDQTQGVNQQVAFDPVDFFSRRQNLAFRRCAWL